MLKPFADAELVLGYALEFWDLWWVSKIPATLTALCTSQLCIAIQRTAINFELEDWDLA